MQTSPEAKKQLAKKIKWISILSAILISIMLCVSVYIYYQIEPLVAARLKETIKTSTNGLYSISFSKLSINPFSGNVTLKNISFKADPAVYERFKRDKISPSHLYEIKVKVLRLKRVHPLKVYLKRDLVINAILVENPSIRVYYEKTFGKDSSKVDTRTTWQRLSKYLHAIKVERVAFRDIDFKYIDRRLQKIEINSVQNLSITIKDILIDSLSHLDKSRLYHTKDVQVEILNNQFTSNDGMYTVKFDKLEMSTFDKYASVSGLQVIPKYPEIEFSLKWPFKKARYRIAVDEARLNGIDYKSLTDKRQLLASSFKLDGAKLDVFMNKQQPKPKGDLGENFPQLLVKSLRLVSVIDTVRIGQSRLTYSEYDPFTAKTGRISFTALNGHILNITNDSAALRKNRWARGKFSAYFYGKGRIDFNINFNLNSPVQEYNYAGKLHKMQAKYFNQITRPLALLDISSGAADSAIFSVKGDYRNALGSMTIFYRDLNIGILKLNRNKRLQRSTILSLVANNLLLKEDNPSKGEPLRTGTIRYTRPDSVSFYSMIWKTLFSGIKENIGMTAEREKALKDQFEKIKQAQPEKNREVRKLQREERRKRRKSNSLER
ncbi:hypothetical protein ACFSJU_02760 [Paradesertivirga mongoliensis]|uniref:AsmA-like C-terminal domain-containing protein n=1 Tax=Paradesertivirga mongoliensis TaxID=2100740 RepID=A0ABW4ZHI5_9SPHI|nr:hypothetical protein [Pedobacter mongoliensis]